jgi:hypothetical protein
MTYQAKGKFREKGMEAKRGWGMERGSAGCGGV